MKKCEGEAVKGMPVKPVTLIMDELKGKVVNAINKAAWQALYGKTGLITFLDGGKVMKKPPPKGI